MAAHSRKPALKRVATGEDSHHPTVGIKKVRFVPPDYKTKHTIGRRKTHVVTYNETLLHYGVMANACIEETAMKQKISEKRSMKTSSNKIALKDEVKSYEIKASLKESVVKDSANDSKSSPVKKSFKKGFVVKESAKGCTAKESVKGSTTKKIIKRSTVNNSLKRSVAKKSTKRSMTKNSTNGTVAHGSALVSPNKKSAKPSSIESSINHSLRKTSMKTARKFSSNLVKKSPKSLKLPSIEDNLLELNQGKKLSVCLIRLKREASLNAAAKVNLIYNENQQNSPGRQTRGLGPASQHRINEALILKNCQLFQTSKSPKPAKQSLSSPKEDKVCKNKKKTFAIGCDRKPNKPFILKKVGGTLKKDTTCIEKSNKLPHNRTKNITTIHDNFKQEIQNPSSLCSQSGKPTLQKKTKVKSNNSNESFTKKPNRLNGYECRKDCIDCHIDTKDYPVDCVDRAKRSCRSRSKCQFSESYLKSCTIDNSTLREKHPDCFLQLTNNKQKHFSSQKKLLSKCVKVCESKNMDIDYSRSKKQVESCLTDYRNLKGFRPDDLSVTNDDPLTVVTTCPNSYQNLKNVMRNHKLQYHNSSPTISLPSNLYSSKGPPHFRSGKEHCRTATTLDFCPANCNKHSLEESPGKLSKRMASLNAQAIMDVCQESRYSKREFLQNSQRAARTHYIFSPKRQSCRWVDGLGMFLTSDLQNSSTKDLKPKIIVSCTATSTSSSSVIGSNISNNQSSSVTSSNNYSPDIQVQTENHGRIKQKSDKMTFEGGPKSTSAQFSKFNSPDRQEMLSGCSSFPYNHIENVSPAQCQTFTLNGIGSISNLSSLPYQPYGSPFTVSCNHGSIPHCSYYSSDSYYRHSSTMVQPIPKPCVMTSPIPIHVPHAEVKVLIHNPHPNQPFMQTTANPCKLQKSRKGSQQTIPKNKIVNSRQKNKAKKKTDATKSICKLRKRNCDLKEVLSEKVDKNSLPSKRKKTNNSNCGWSWEGESEMKPVPNLNIDAPPIERKCYPAIKHTDGELIHVRDCVLLRSGPRKKDLPYTAKVVAFWENPTDGEMMMSLLWYYRPEHTESGRQPHNIDCEVFASKHRDINSVACIEEKCFVLTFNEYSRYKAEVRRSESNFPARRKVVPASEIYPRQNRLPPIDADPETVFLCRKVYHFRQKRILKN